MPPGYAPRAVTKKDGPGASGYGRKPPKPIGKGHATSRHSAADALHSPKMVTKARRIHRSTARIRASNDTTRRPHNAIYLNDTLMLMIINKQNTKFVTILAERMGMDSYGLSRREIEVLRLIAEGQSSKEISLTLGISPRTVESHTDHIRQKMGARKRSKLAAMAAALGLSSIDRSS